MSAVQVAVRARPLSQRELASDCHFCLEMRGRSTTLYPKLSTHRRKGEGPVARTNAKEFYFDYSYWSVNVNDNHYANQEQVYSDLGIPVIEAAFAGYNSCVFAYGQTGSGKTYTMTGYGAEPGLIPRICGGLYSRIESGVEGRSVSYKTEVSYMEIYNEKVRDLLAEGGKVKQKLRVREHPKEGPYVEGLSRHVVEGYRGIAALLEAGNSQRATASTKMNDTSSRSHAIFTLVMTQAVFECGLPSETRSKLHLVDLAGSERASATRAEGARLKEGGSINRSLVCLGTVISALADKAAHHGNKSPYIPYRDSVLTYLLKDSLGGNAKTIMIATVSPSDSSYGETLSTLRYASRAKAIINKPVVNEDASVKVIRELRSEINRLKAIITTQHLNMDMVPGKLSKSTVSLVEDIHKKEEQVAELTKEWASKWKDIQQIIEARDVALHSEGAKMVVHSDQPHLVGIDPDILSTGLVFFYLKGDSTTVGSVSANPPADIVVPGADIADQHCRLAIQRGRVLLQPLGGECYINHCRVMSLGRLRQGDLLQLGGSAVFRFNHPQEAKRLRKRHSDGLLDPRRPARQRHYKRVKFQDTPCSHGLSTCQSSPKPVTVMELQSRAVVRATEHSPPATSVTFPGVQRSQGSYLIASGERQEEAMKEGWSALSLVKIAMSPLTLLKMVVNPLCVVETAAASNDQTTLTEDHLCEPGTAQSPLRWRRWLYVLLLLCNAPLLLVVVGILTFPAFSILAVLLSSVKVLGTFRRFWPSHWLATLLAVVTTFVVAPVAGLCDVVFRVGFSSLTALHLLPPSLSLHRTQQPG